MVAAAGVLLAPATAPCVIAIDTSTVATRQTSTQGLTAQEAEIFSLLGRFRSFLGTPIDATHFLTARHVGIDPSDTITFPGGVNAGTYSIVGWVDDPGSDLRLVEIAGRFQDWVPLNASSYEANRTATVFGRGGAVQGEVRVGPELKGWTALAPDGQISWGRNVVTGSQGPSQLYTRFESNGIPYEAGLTTGDSGGPWFAPDGQGLLRLIGITFGTLGPFQLDVGGAPSGSPFQAALFDLGGLWLGEIGDEIFLPENPVNVPSIGTASRISDRMTWIATQIDLSTTDTDRDGVANEFDNCPWVPNPSQQDTGGLGSSSVPDGIGDACQCGDVTGEGQVNDTDATFIKRHALGLSAPLFLLPDHCDVNGDGSCSGTDATLIRHAAAGKLSPLFGQNCPDGIP